MKVNNEKTYDTFIWNAIFATLANMKVSAIQISWIKACISFVNCSLLINGKPYMKIQAFMGIRQGDPLSAYLFISVSQSLSSILNFALNLHLVLGFDHKITNNDGYSPRLSLFHKGMELPYWLMKTFKKDGLKFLVFVTLRLVQLVYLVFFSFQLQLFTYLTFCILQFFT